MSNDYDCLIPNCLNFSNNLESIKNADLEKAYNRINGDDFSYFWNEYGVKFKHLDNSFGVKFLSLIQLAENITDMPINTQFVTLKNSQEKEITSLVKKLKNLKREIEKLQLDISVYDPKKSTIKHYLKDRPIMNWVDYEKYRNDLGIAKLLGDIATHIEDEDCWLPPTVKGNKATGNRRYLSQQFSKLLKKYTDSHHDDIVAELLSVLLKDGFNKKDIENARNAHFY